MCAQETRNSVVPETGSATTGSNCRPTCYRVAGCQQRAHRRTRQHRDTSVRSKSGRQILSPLTERRTAENKDSYPSGMAPVIDAMDLMHKCTLKRVVMVSSDCDFERLAQSPREEDLKACGFGERKRDFSKTTRRLPRGWIRAARHHHPRRPDYTHAHRRSPQADHVAPLCASFLGRMTDPGQQHSIEQADCSLQSMLLAGRSRRLPSSSATIASRKALQSSSSRVVSSRERQSMVAVHL